VKTLTDGGKHYGSENFPTSFILTHSQVEASKMLRLDVEYTEQKFKILESNKNLEKNDIKYIKRHSSNIGEMTLNYNYKDTNDFLYSLQTDIKLPTKTRDIYLYLPNRMMGIYPTINLFSNIDLMTGAKGVQPFFYKTTKFKNTKNYIDLGRGIIIDKKTNQLVIQKQKVPIKRFVKTFHKNGKLQTKVQVINPTSKYNVIYMQNYGQFLLVEDSVYNSTYFQLFVLENYDKSLFEPIILTPLAKVYKLRI
jgi:dolichyl-diphosphooligosaccharide--protein glycosyltransferase/undecaprenyl-diphosphooligosaccharide--protein glycosyltransferase